jgi:hypothetical protein
VRIFLALALLELLTAACGAQETAAMESRQAAANVPLSQDPGLPFWREAHPIYAQLNARGDSLPEYRTEVRSRWTKDSLYLLFICPYQHLYLKPSPDRTHETYGLWKWNVAEAFIGSDFENIKRYKEFEVSPQGEWVDLDINLGDAHHESGWLWNSGFEHSARIDEAKHVWSAVMRIPFAALDAPAPVPGRTFRANFYRTEGRPEEQKQIMWQPTLSKTFHVPERFGLLRLVR